VISARKLSAHDVTLDFISSEGQEPLRAGKATYEEKTCCLTSDEGFEFSAPMVAVVAPGDFWSDDAVPARSRS
jgi:hypothetical protein